IVLRGYPVPGGFTHPDGGSGMPGPDSGVIIPDAGRDEDAGCIDSCVEDDGGMGTAGGSGSAGGGEMGAGGGGTPMVDGRPGCGCSGGAGLVWVAGALLLAARRRRA
ncbi:MAG: hypothetical protein JNK82_43230, partial [Myxococcaceae bacterium]|nr:hypothetical protein [Myxococcaceae bacterium]